jgi:hypothetical protein
MFNCLRGSRMRSFFIVLIFAAAALRAAPLRAESFTDWAAANSLSGGDALPTGNPDGDPYINALEYAFGTDPRVPDLISTVGPSLTVLSNTTVFAYRVSTQALGVATFRVVQATNLSEPVWTDVAGTPVVVPVSPSYSMYYQPVDTNGLARYFRLEVTVPYSPDFAVKVLVGTDVGGGSWDGLPVISQVFIRQQAPDIAVTVTNSGVFTNHFPNVTKYPEVVATSLTAATPDFFSSLNTSGKRLPMRSWMGWFLWANGTPPPGLSPGYPVTGSFDTNSAWDFFSFQFPAKSTNAAVDGAWQPIRLDQQPLYLNPFRVNYAWPPGQFGYKTQPLLPFVQQAGYWASKKIVRGPNLSFPTPFFVQYGDRVSTGDTPDVWRDSWFFMRTRPLETLLLVPSNLKPDQLLQNGAWNNTGTNHEPFPYPVWNTNLAAADQTPFEIQVDRMGDWDADLIWEGTHPGAANYAANRYQRTAFNQAGKGNYLKMTVAQGSPFIWCETHSNRYVNFYNLIRQNLTNSIASNTGTGAKTVAGGPWPVPGVSGVNYVLVYGDQNNPNQWYHEAAPWFYDAATSQPGGFNPPGAQHNYTYLAIYYRTSAVQTVTLGAGGPGSTQNNGTDSQGNPYFYLEFKKSDKNWFVVGSVPVMSYYHSGVFVDPEAVRVAAAREWAELMGKYAFNFVTRTKITYSSSNMDLVTTTYSNTVVNPYVAAGDASASGMTPNSVETVMALMPHHYQAFTLGPDLTKANRQQIQWRPLKQYGIDFPALNDPPPNANKNNPASPSRWGYWGPRGTMKTIVTGSFVTQYPFQNFLPVLPPPNLATNYIETGIQVLRITDVGSGYHSISNPVPKVTIHTASPTNGSGATFQALLEPFTGKVMQVDVGDPGSGYPDGNPPSTNLVWLTIDPPQIPQANGGRQASARLQIGGGKVLAVFMNDKGAGYESTITVTQANVSVDSPIIVPPFDAGGNLALGAAKIISGGAGFDFSNSNNPPIVNIVGTGTGAKAEILRPGDIINVGSSGIGGFTTDGLYPSSGDLTNDAARIQASLPPVTVNGQSQAVVVKSVSVIPGVVIAAVTDKGQYGSQPTASIVDDNNVTIQLGVNYVNGEVLNVYRNGDPAPKIITPKTVTFSGGEPVTRPAQAIVYGGVTVSGVALAGPTVGGYAGSSIVSFTSGEILPDGVTLPKLAYKINTNGTIGNVSVAQPGTGWNYGGVIRIDGGKGFDAAATPILGPSGEILAVKLLRQGNNYPATVYPRIVDIVTPSQPAHLSVQVQGGRIVSINVDSGGIGYTNPVITFTSTPGGDEINQPAKGGLAEVSFEANGAGGITNVVLTKPGTNYLAGTETNATPDSPKTFLRFDAVNPMPFARPVSQAANYVGTAVVPSLSVDQVLYDNLITQYKQLASADLKPFGGGFGGSSGPDGYGLGNQLSAAAKYIGVLYDYQQLYAAQGKDQPGIPPSSFAFDDGKVPASAYELPIYRAHQPMLTLRGGLESSVQGLQRTLSLLHQDPPYENSPADTDWKMQYFADYDTKAGRLVINPSGTIPVKGVVSTIINPPPISAGENAAKTGLKRWQPGMLWSGFGVSDQWNDQHYFYGYYLGAAGLMAILDQSWSTNIVSKPANLWADPGKMGTGIDQWLMTLAYDPDNVPLVNSLYRKPEFTYQKFAFFDQWNGHGWATGVSPGRAGDVEDGKFGALVPWSVWLSHGTGSGSYDDENENSVWEGLQAFSAIVLWGGGTDRKPVVDLGMYLLATGNSAGDMYFHDKNYNLPNSPSNQFSWVPVTTVNSSAVGKNGGNNNTPANTGFVETTAPAFYAAPEAFGGKGSAGTSIIHKGSPSLNNFFYAFPTGSKFIQSFPPAPWTLGMTRNSDYMRRWAGAMMRDEWKQARDSSLYQPANWLSMAMACAVSGVPYNPGDTPYGLTGNSLSNNAPQPYVNRLWSSWVTLNAAAGAQAARQPAFSAIEVLNFLHVLDTYGTPDWTYVAKATTAAGADDNSGIVFTAAFSKPVTTNSVRTTFVAFNPGWQTRHASFYRITQFGTIGTTPVAPEMPLTIAPKRMAVLTKDLPIN